MKGQQSHLRTRIPAEGMNYKGYNIAVHEFGHNVEQTISMYNVDNFMMAGVPNTAFTEALAFVFQKRDLQLLGIENNDPEKDKMDILDKFWSLYEIMGVSMLDISIWEWLYGNPNALESALENIVRNALRYSHTKIEVGFAVDKDGITITVDDDGPGVSPEDREQIFRPFYRTDEARDRESGGTGLGLAIVETAIQQHRGWVKAEDSPLGGLRLVIWLPLYKRS